VNYASGSPGARILGLGGHRPARVMTNDEIAQKVETSDSWIRERTGIVTRHIAAPDEGVDDMAAEAGLKAIAAAGLTPDDIDFVLLGSCTLPSVLPGLAPTLATKIGAHGAGAADINAACSGFSYGLSWAADAVRSGSARHVLVAGSERFSSWIDWNDRGTCIIFGDGAGAAVVGPSDEPGIGPVTWGSDGNRARLIEVPGRDRLAAGEAAFVRMDGQAVFRWATTSLAPAARRACELAGIEISDLAAVVPHQANLRIIDALVRALGAEHAVVARDVVDSGNTSAASIPLALSRLVERGEVRTGDQALLFGFGAGLSYAGQVVTCP